jgi:CheY-like chemotaxis protein
MENLKRILAVDDVLTNLNLIGGILSPYYKVSMAKTTDQALRILYTTDIDLILLDIEMPDMNGFEFMDYLRQSPKTNSIPVIFVTSHSSRDYVTKAVSKGAVNFVSKPINQDMLLGRVRSVFYPNVEVRKSDPVVNAKLFALLHACKNNEYGLAISLSNELQRMKFGDETAALIGDLCSYVMSLDFESAIPIIEKLIGE